MTSPASPADLYCVMGNPVAHSRSPAIHARFAELTGEHIAYERRLVPMDGFAQGVRAFAAEGGRGCNVTVPFKTEAPGLATECSERVQLAGAANTLTFRADGSIYADNTDGLGLVADITRNAGVSLAGRDVLLVGAGGAAAGVLGPPHHCGQPHPGQGAGAGAVAQCPGRTTKSRAVSARPTSAIGLF